MRRLKTVYLTINDSPSELMAARVALLSELRIPAVFFCTGDRLSARSQPAIEASSASASATAERPEAPLHQPTDERS